MNRLVYLFFILSVFFNQQLQAQTLLDADGPGNTYSLITSVLAPGYNPIEVPDCGHSAFGDHIDEVFDADLNTNVFRFYIHVNDDDDRCINTDRQRNEIKTYDQSPDNLLGISGETVEYKWKFKLDAGFQSSPSFTHIHQLKAVGGTESSMPLITLTTRKGTPDKLQLRYAETTSQITLADTDLTPFKGEWVDVKETVTYGENGAYAIEIKKVSDGSVLFTYTDNDIRMWKTNASFIRPKWGIYRSLNYPSDLRDEAVLFANFSIEELTVVVPVELISFTAKRTDDGIQLDWQTASEFNNKGFEVQRSNNLNTNWKPLTFIEANDPPNSLNDYEYTDNEPITGINYYRLRQIDKDDNFQLSDSIAAFFYVQEQEVQLLTNPVKNSLTLVGLTEEVFIEIYTINGQKVKEGYTQQFQFDMTSLTDGIFVVHIHHNDGLFKKLVKY